MSTSQEPPQSPIGTHDRVDVDPGPEGDPAELYALVHEGFEGDVDFYKRVCRDRKSILELGSGWGRVLLPLAEEGHEIVGLESSATMRDATRRRMAAMDPQAAARVTLVDGDMVDFKLDRDFDLIIIPFTGLYCLLTDSDLQSCLKCIAAHLRPEGHLVFDAYPADDFHANCEPGDYPDDRLEQVARVEHHGRELQVFEKSTWDRDTQRMDATYVYEEQSGQVLHRDLISHRYLLSEQVAPALELAGLSLLLLHGDFEGNAFNQESARLVAFAGVS